MELEEIITLTAAALLAGSVHVRPCLTDAPSDAEIAESVRSAKRIWEQVLADK